jgi:hypothetical protein
MTIRPPVRRPPAALEPCGPALKPRSVPTRRHELVVHGSSLYRLGSTRETVCWLMLATQSELPVTLSAWAAGGTPVADCGAI